MATYSNSAREVEMPNGDVVVLHNAPTGGANTTSNIKKFKYDDNGHVTESTAADAEDLNLSSYSTPTTGTTAIGTSDDVQTAIGKLDHQSHIDQTNIWLVNKYGGGKNYINSNDLDAIKALNTTGWTWNNNVAQKNSVSFTVNKDGTIKVNGTPSALTEFKLPIDHQTEIDGTSVLSTGILDTGDNPIVMRYSGGSYAVPDNYGYVAIPANTVATEIIIQVRTTGTAPSNLLYKPMLCITEDWDASHDYQQYGKPNYDLTRGLAELNAHPFLTIPFNHNMIYRGQNLGDTLTDAQHTALSSGNFTDLYLGDYWTKTVTIPAGTYTGGDGEEVTVPAQTNITLKAVIADFDTFYAGYASSYAGINTHHAAVIVTGFSNVVWNKTNSTAGGYVASLIHKWLVGSALPQIETWFGSAKVLSHQKLLTNAITGDAASEWAWSSQKIALLSENQMYGSKVWGNSKASNGGYEPGEAFKHLNIFNHIDADLLFGDKNIWLRDIASAERASCLYDSGGASYVGASITWIAPAALILLS